MPTFCPTSGQLVEAVREFIEQEIVPVVDGPLAFNTRVALNVLRIVERETSFSQVADEAERTRLVELLGREGSRDELNGALCEQLRAAQRDITEPALCRHLRQTTLAKLAIDNPKYAAYRRARQSG